MSFKQIKKIATAIMLFVLIFQSFFSPVASVAETIETKEDEKSSLDLKQIKLTKNEEDSAVVTIKMAANNKMEKEQIHTLTTNLPVEIAQDSEEKSGITTKVEDQKIEVAVASNTETENTLKLNVEKKSQNEQTFTVTNDTQKKEIVIPSVATKESEETTSSSEETSDEDEEVSEQKTTESTASEPKTSSEEKISDSKEEATDPEEKTTDSKEQIEEAQEDTKDTKEAEDTKDTEETKEATKETKDAEDAKEEESQTKRSPINIQALFEGDEKFITDVDLKVDGKEVTDGQEIPADALFELIYHWEIPNRLLAGHEGLLQAGDYYETKLPKGIKATNQSGKLVSKGIEYGTYEIKQDGTIRWTFNEKVETEGELKGTVSYSQHLNEDENAGDAIIKFPIDGGNKEHNIVIKPDGGQSISKEAENDVKNNKVTWKVSINTNLDKLTHATVTDKMPEGLDLDKLTIYPQNIDKNGNVIGQDTDHPLVEGRDYKINGDTVTFIGDYAQTSRSFQLVYETTVKNEKIPGNGGPVSFKNIATLKNDGTKEQLADAQTKMEYGKLIDKEFKGADDTSHGNVYKWQIKYNYGNKTLPKGAHVADTLENENSEFIPDSVIVKTAAGKTLAKDTDYKLDFDGQKMRITFPDGLEEAVTIDYKTKFTKVIDNSISEAEKKLINKVSTEGGYEAEANGKVNTDNLAKDSSIDYDKRKINWKVTVNRFNYEMANWYLEDTLSKGLDLDKDTFKIVEKDGRTLTEGQDYKLTIDGQKLKVEFIGDLKKGTDKTYFITYQTGFERRASDLNNKANSHWIDPDGDSGKPGKEYTNSTEHKPTVKNEFKSDVTKGGSYNAQNKHITWTTRVNYTKDDLQDATITDPIAEDQDYVAGSAKLYEVAITSNGNTQRGREVSDADISYNEENKTVTAKLPDGNKAYQLVFETSLAGKVIDQTRYRNKATFKNGDTYSKDAQASVSVRNSNVFVNKSGKQDEGNGNYVAWSATINPSQSTMKDVTIVDEPSTNQVLDENSFKIYGTKVATNGTITKDPSVVLEKDKDYSLDITTDNETGKQVATIKMKGTIDRAYILEYKGLINADKNGKNTVTNKISIKGTGEKSVSGNVEGKTDVIVSGGTAEGTKASVTLEKVDKKSGKNALAGAKLELWSTNSKGEKQQLVRSGTTDKNGQLRFGNLRADHKYLLFETQAPDGYTISDELKKGKEIKLSADKEGEGFATVKVTNDIPQISFNKVDETGKGLSGAVFTIKNTEGQYYNGLNANNSVKWVDDVEDISSSVKTALTSANNGKVTVEGLPVGKYKIKELTAPKDYKKITKETSFEVVNKDGSIQLAAPIQDIENEATKYVDIPVIKKWEDKGNQDGVRPDSVEVELYADGKATGKTKELTQENDWKTSFDKLRKTEATSKEEIKYTVKEIDANKHYTSKTTGNIVDGFIITNSYKPATTSIDAKKVWDDANNQDGIRPENIKVQLYADGEKTGDPVELNAANKWQTQWQDLDLKAKGKTIDYKVKEVDHIKDYDSEVEGNAQKGFTITNSHQPEKIDISGTKTWDDNDDQDGKRPKSITVYLMNGTEVVKTAKTTAANDWKYSFKDLPKFKNGDAINYTVFEDVVEDYSTETDGYNLTNRHTPGKTSVNVTKDWQDEQNQDGKRPDSIDVVLKADGKKTNQSLTLDEDNHWQGSFSDLDEYQNGKRIEYTVEEAKVDDYDSQIKEVQEGNFVITNTHEPELSEIHGTKTWQDDDNQDGLRPDKITLRLFANDVEVDKKEVTQEDNWKYEFVNLPKYEAGKKIDYRMEEDAVTGYETEQEGFDFTNVHDSERIDIQGNKTWKDQDDQEGQRPENITVRLLADGKEVDSKEVTAEDDWKYEFTDLPKYTSGQEINYHVQEDEVKDYSATVDGFDITNEYTPDTMSLNVIKTWQDEYHQKARPDHIKVELYADGQATGETITLNADNHWQGDFTDLANTKNGKEIKYTVKEQAVKGYKTSVEETGNGAVITNTYDETESSYDDPSQDVDGQINEQPGQKDKDHTAEKKSAAKEKTTGKQKSKNNQVKKSKKQDVQKEENKATNKQAAQAAKNKKSSEPSVTSEGKSQSSSKGTIQKSESFSADGQTAQEDKAQSSEQARQADSGYSSSKEGTHRKEGISSTDEDKQKGILPKTGEDSGVILTIIGIVVIVAAVIGYGKKWKK